MTDVIDRFSGDYRFLSNFYPVKVEFDGRAYPSVEHAYQAAKTFNKEDRVSISKLTAGQAKRYGAEVRLRDDWEHIKLNVMKNLLQQKFNREANYDLWLLLQNTKNAKLIEGNDWGDMYWGVCNGVGANHLGRLLMEVRNEG